MNLHVPRGARALVILVQGAFPALVEMLYGARFAVCSVDDDVYGAAQYCDERVALPTFLVGYADGGGVALLAAHKILNLRGVATWSARSQPDILRAASRLQVPLLVIHGALDKSVPVAQADEIAAAAPDVTRVILGTASHTYEGRELMLAAEVTARFIAAYS